MLLSLRLNHEGASSSYGGECRTRDDRRVGVGRYPHRTASDTLHTVDDGGYQVFCVRRGRETLYVVEGITQHGTGDQGRGHRRTTARLPLAGGFAGRRGAV